MSILIDPPRWPAHGTVFSHVVSDSTLEELHGFAARLQLPTKAFDRDHYDLPQSRYADAVAAGALEVSGGQLVRALVTSGLRIPARFRPEKLSSVLSTRWERTLPGQQVLGASLVERWSENHRRYHDRVHLLSVLEALDWLCQEAVAPLPRQVLQLAAWYHDAVYQGTEQDEQASADLATDELRGLVSEKDLTKIHELILMTTDHNPATDDLSALILNDADLEVLARPAAAYQRYTAAIREEYAQFAPEVFARGRADILEGLLNKPRIFATRAGQERWEAQAQENVSREHRLLLTQF